MYQQMIAKEDAVAYRINGTVRVVYGGKAGCNTVDSTTAFLYSDCCIFYGMVIYRFRQA